jgi:hypothetical protein
MTRYTKMSAVRCVRKAHMTVLGHLTTTIQLSYTFSTYFTSVILKSSYKTKGHLKFMMLILSTITTEIYDYKIRNAMHILGCCTEMVDHSIKK